MDNLLEVWYCPISGKAEIVEVVCLSEQATEFSDQLITFYMEGNNCIGMQKVGDGVQRSWKPYDGPIPKEVQSLLFLLGIPTNV